MNLTEEQIQSLKAATIREQKRVNAQIKKSITIIGDKITVNGVTRTLTNPPRNRQERIALKKKIIAAL